MILKCSDSLSHSVTFIFKLWQIILSIYPLTHLLPSWNGRTQLLLEDVKYHKLFLKHCGINKAQNIFSNTFKKFLSMYLKKLFIHKFLTHLYFIFSYIYKTLELLL